MRWAHLTRLVVRDVDDLGRGNGEYPSVSRCHSAIPSSTAVVRNAAVADLLFEEIDRRHRRPAVRFLFDDDLRQHLPSDVLASLRVNDFEITAFTPQVGGASVEFRPVNDSWQRYSVYSPIA